MTQERMWIAVRCHDGSWTYGGRPEDYKDYVDHEIFRVMAVDGKQAVKKAQAERRRSLKKQMKH